MAMLLRRIFRIITITVLSSSARVVPCSNRPAFLRMHWFVNRTPKLIENYTITVKQADSDIFFRDQTFYGMMNSTCSCYGQNYRNVNSRAGFPVLLCQFGNRYYKITLFCVKILNLLMFLYLPFSQLQTTPYVQPMPQCITLYTYSGRSLQYETQLT